MQTVSILPPEIKSRYRFRRKKRFIVLVSILLMVVLLTAYALLSIAAYGRSLELDSVREQRERVEEQVSDLEKYGELKAEVEFMEELLVQSMGGVPHWHILLEKLGIHIPDGVWITSFSADYSRDDESGQLSLSGMAHNKWLVASWVEEMYEIEELEGVRFHSSAQGEYDGVTHVDFDVSAVILPREGYESPEEEGD